jgi:hypothetical protein
MAATCSRSTRINELPKLVLNAVFEEAGPIEFKYASALGCEGIVSKRRGSRNVAAEPNIGSSSSTRMRRPVWREAEEDWGRLDQWLSRSGFTSAMISFLSFLYLRSWAD